MPTYVYNCRACGEFEIKQSMKDDTLTTCPKCGGKNITKVVTASAGFVFKGSGSRAPEPGCGGCAHSAGCPHNKGN